MERNRYVLIFSYYKPWTLFLLSPMIFIMDLATLIFSAKGEWLSEKLDVYHEWLTPSYWDWIKRRRKRIGALRTVGDRKLLRLAVGEIAFQGEGVKNPVLEKIGNPIMGFYWKMVKNLLF